MYPTFFENTLVRLLILLCLVLLNGLFALAELAVVSSRSARLEEHAQNGSARARATLKIVDDPTDFLSTVQIGITLIGIVAGAFSGTTLAATLTEWLTTFGIAAQTGSTISYVVVVGFVTYLSLTIGELIPKAIGLSNPERYAMLLAPPLRPLTIITLPIVRLLSVSTHYVLGLLNIDDSAEPPVTEEEVKYLLEEGKVAGVFEPDEQRLVHRALELDDIAIQELTTPSADVHSLLMSDDRSTIVRKAAENKHAYYPICLAPDDSPHAVVRASELLTLFLDTENNDDVQDASLASIAHDPPYLPASAAPVEAIQTFRDSGLHIIFIHDEEEQFLGIITPGNILEGLVGVIPEVE